MKKKIIMSVLTIALAAIIGALIPMRTYSVSAASAKEYISEVKIGIGKTEEEATKELLAEGFTILKNGKGAYADLNEDADDANSTKKIVYLGYKTTTKVEEAITDLAVMNMRGGYSVRDYEVLMENQLKTQVIPFVNRFIATLDEYRENLRSENPANKARAEYMRSMLNKLKDDDTGALLGDLLVSETKYEMGDEAYNRLSASQKKQHADILTIIMQANGKNTLTMETLLTKASDATGSTWITRLQHTTLDSLASALGEDVDPTDYGTELDKLYEDDAKKILEKWDTFCEALMSYDDKANALANTKESDYADEIAKMEKFDENNNTPGENGDAMIASMDAQDKVAEAALDMELVAAYERLDEIEYDSDGGYTLLDFFTQEYSDFDGDGIRNLYPLVASLSAGQIAGLDFLSLQDLVTIATANAESYNLNELGNTEPASIYEGVNREVFQKGMTALTNKALRAEAAKNDAVTDFSLSPSSYVLWGATAVATAGMITSWIMMSKFQSAANMFRGVQQNVADAFTKYRSTVNQIIDTYKDLSKTAAGNAQNAAFTGLKADIIKQVGEENLSKVLGKFGKSYKSGIYDKTSKTIETLTTKSKICQYLGAAFTVAMAALAAYSIYSTIKEMMDYYKVDYSPIPKYIVEETDITTYNAKGEKVVLNNNSAYYRAVECNRPSDDKNYEVLQNFADLNGDVGRQWLALYSVKFEGKAPIIADSLIVVKGSTALSDGYSTGIHKFGETAAFDLNSEYYVFNKSADDIYVYFKTDDSAILPASTAAGSTFSMGSVFLYGGIGAVVGAAIAVVVLLAMGKKKETPAEA